ncbi:MAG: hypothetical protein WBJ10_04650, partial [Daejeonella sp.]|uniref:hypothetical protein n=1 Tax=Daejeonella sp. TaxID=2805397 RepID=UPI003C73950E
LKLSLSYPLVNRTAVFSLEGSSLRWKEMGRAMKYIAATAPTEAAIRRTKRALFFRRVSFQHRKARSNIDDMRMIHFSITGSF